MQRSAIGDHNLRGFYNVSIQKGIKHRNFSQIIEFKKTIANNGRSSPSTRIKAKVTRLRTRITQADGIDEEQAEARMEKLQDTYKEFESIQRQLLDKEGEFNDEDALEQKYFEGRYFEVKSLLK